MSNSLTKLTDWIKVYDDVIPQDFCDKCIALFDDPNASKSSFTEGWRRCHQVSNLDSMPLFSEFVSLVKKAFKRYKEEVPNGNLHFLSKIEAPNIFHYEAKDPAGAHLFHLHADNWNTDTATRQLSVIIYLNDVETGGATTFTDLDYSVQPKRGRILLFPSFFTYLHKGEAPLSGSKYIIVSWLHYGGPTVYRTHSF